MNVMSEAHRLLRNDLYLHLEEAEYLADFDGWTMKQQRTARALIGNLVTVIRGIIVLHDNRSPHCPTCTTPWPCTNFETIHRLVKSPDTEFVKLVNAQRSAQ